MPQQTVYHGSMYQFSRPDPRYYGAGDGRSMYGQGFYVAVDPDYAQEHLNERLRDYRGRGGAVYAMDINLSDDNVISENKPLTNEQFDRFINSAREQSQLELAKQLEDLRKFTKTGDRSLLPADFYPLRNNISGYDLRTIVEHTIGQGPSAVFFRNAGVGAFFTLGGSSMYDMYMIVDPEIVIGETRVHELIGNGPIRNNAYKLLELGELSSEEFKSALHSVRATQNREMISSFKSLAAFLVSDEYNMRGLPNNGAGANYHQQRGFDLRDGMGHAIQRMLRDGGLDDDYFGGQSTWQRQRQQLLDLAGDDPKLLEVFDRFETAMFDHIEKVHGHRPVMPDMRNPHIPASAVDDITDGIKAASKMAKAARFGGVVPVIGIAAGLAGAGLTTSAHAAQRDYAQQLYEQGVLGEGEKALKALNAYNELSVKFNLLYGADATGGSAVSLLTLGAAEAGTWIASVGIELEARKEFQQWADKYAPNLSDEQHQALAMSLFAANSSRTDMLLEAADNLPDNAEAENGTFNAAIEARNAYKRAYVEMTNENGRLAGQRKTPEQNEYLAKLDEASEKARAAMIAEMETLMNDPENIDRFLDTVSPEDRLDYVRRLAASDPDQDALSQNHPEIAAYLKEYDGSWTGMWLDKDNILLADSGLLNAYIKERNGMQSHNDVQFAQITTHMDKLAQEQASPKLPELQALVEVYKQDGTGPEFKSYLTELRSSEHWPDIMIELSELFPLKNTFSVAGKPPVLVPAPEQVEQLDASA